MNKTIILGSSSRDRIKIFKRAGIPTKIIVSDYEEDKSLSKSPKDLVKILAEGKLNNILEKIRQDPEYSYLKSQKYIVITADTIVSYNNKIIGKAENRTHAQQILKMLAGQEHELITGVYMYDSTSEKRISFYDSTIVRFTNLTDQQINDYLDYCDEYKGRAGAYSLMERASLFIDYIRGSPSNVIGIPMHIIRQGLAEFNVNLLQVRFFDV
ncbi:MAG: septum formation protein Maf [Candidatus Lokiarchaeota archaeon]|nr:septum formation protein Maf [Candidatus Lokiarchaeota archaeon]